MIGQTLGHYQILEKLGGRRESIVYHALDNQPASRRFRSRDRAGDCIQIAIS
jgi:hypothetical protein